MQKTFSILQASSKKFILNSPNRKIIDGLRIFESDLRGCKTNCKHYKNFLAARFQNVLKDSLLNIFLPKESALVRRFEQDYKKYGCIACRLYSDSCKGRKMPEMKPCPSICDEPPKKKKKPKNTDGVCRSICEDLKKKDEDACGLENTEPTREGGTKPPKKAYDSSPGTSCCGLVAKCDKKQEVPCKEVEKPICCPEAPPERRYENIDPHSYLNLKTYPPVDCKLMTCSLIPPKMLYKEKSCNLTPKNAQSKKSKTCPKGKPTCRAHYCRPTPIRIVVKKCEKGNEKVKKKVEEKIISDYCPNRVKLESPCPSSIDVGSIERPICKRCKYPSRIDSYCPERSKPVEKPYCDNMKRKCKSKKKKRCNRH